MKIDLTQEESETICTLIEGFKIRSEKNLQSVFMPDHYKKIDVLHWLFAKCMQETQVTDYDILRSTKEWQRTREEFEEFAERKLTNLLRYMIYLVDFMRENDIVWGVGRGSSVSSYVLYLINVHKIDSIKYNLDWREFLRD